MSIFKAAKDRVKKYVSGKDDRASEARRKKLNNQEIRQAIKKQKQTDKDNLVLKKLKMQIEHNNQVLRKNSKKYAEQNKKKGGNETPKRSYKGGFSKGGEVGYSKGGIVDRQYLKGR